MQIATIWIAAAGLGLLALPLAVAGWLWRRRIVAQRLPRQWSLTPRPVFSADERRVFRLLREALPHHVVLSKLPLVRFCQPTEAREQHYWFSLLGSAHVTFAVCSPNGRVLAAIDLEGERGVTTRALQIKNAVLDACRVRYLRVAMDHLPSVAELQLLAPGGSPAAARGPQAAPTASSRGRNGRDDDGNGSDWGQFSQPLPLWQDGALFGDTDQGSLTAGRRRTTVAGAPEDIVGVVVDTPRHTSARGR
jgi:hypothetical protein